LHYYCKQCVKDKAEANKEKNRAWREKNKEEIKAYQQKYRKDNRERLNEYQRARPIEKKRNANTSEKKKQRDKQRRQDEFFKEKRRAYDKNKYRQDIQYRLKKQFEAKLNYLLKKDDTTGAVPLIGCSIPQYKEYLEQRFIKGMSWDNYGEIWCIDRVVPFCNWDLTKAEQAALCYHYSNSTPLFVITTWVDRVEHVGNLSKNRY